VLVKSPREAMKRLSTTGVSARVQVFGDRLHAWTTASDAAAAEREFRQAAAQADLEVAGVRAIKPSLEDVFIAKLSTPSETAVS
jgi:hypothetical protein